MLKAVHDVAEIKLEAWERNSLHVAFCHGLLPLKVLVSLLVADSSRRNAVQNLIAEFGREDRFALKKDSS